MIGRRRLAPDASLGGAHGNPAVVRGQRCYGRLRLPLGDVPLVVSARCSAGGIASVPGAGDWTVSRGHSAGTNMMPLSSLGVGGTLMQPLPRQPKQRERLMLLSGLATA